METQDDVSLYAMRGSRWLVGINLWPLRLCSSPQLLVISRQQTVAPSPENGTRMVNALYNVAQFFQVICGGTLPI
jgi:hypothetical protein